MDQLQSDPYNYRLKDVGPPTRYLGAKIERFIDCEQGINTWSISADLYLEKVLPVIEERFGSLKQLIGNIRSNVPADPKYHPEIDESDFLDEDGTRLYQSYIGIIRWAVELGRIDLAHTASTMAKFLAAPREGHLTALIRVFAYIRKHPKSKIVIDPYERDWSDKQWVNGDWTEFYHDAKEVLPANMPKARGKGVQLNMFCDAAHATDLMTRRSTTGVIFMLNGTPVKWYSKRQNTIESSTFGSEFVALKIAAEMNEGLRYKLRMFGVPVNGPTNGFCDNNSVVVNVTRPESVLQKKHNAVAYHKVRECIAAQSLRICHEPGEFNLSDVTTKWLPASKHMFCCKGLLYGPECG